jgi:proteasome lid subunit RPN8/RPN11
MLKIPATLLDQIHAHGESAYPDEAAGFLLGQLEGNVRRVTSLVFLTNAREDSARHNRYLLTAEDYLAGEQEAARLGWEILGVFHSHPDHPNLPSDFDREWALPWFSYLITTIRNGRAAGSRCWRLADDRQSFMEENLT